MSSPSALLKVNYLVMRYLHFESLRGDLQEGNGCASRCQFPIFSSTKSGFLCQNRQFSPGFCPFRAQNRGFCALVLGNMASGSRKARKFLFLHAFKLLLPLGHCRQSTWAPGTGAPGHRGTVKPWNCGTLGTWAAWNRGTACGGTAPRPECSLVMPTLA